MAMTLIRTNTSSDAASSDFTSGINSTYKLYIFKFYDINPATDSVDYVFEGSVSDSFGTTKTTTAFMEYHDEADTTFGLTYDTGKDLAQSTSPQILVWSAGNGADESTAGELLLFNPSSTTYVKHFYSTNQYYHKNNYSQNTYIAGYFNTTSAIDGIRFSMSSGNFDGTIKMYGVG